MPWLGFALGGLAFPLVLICFPLALRPPRPPVEKQGFNNELFFNQEENDYLRPCNIMDDLL